MVGEKGKDKGNGHNKEEAEEVARQRKILKDIAELLNQDMGDMQERSKRCNATLCEFSVWLENMSEETIGIVRDRLGETVAYYMSKSQFKILLLSNPDILMDIVSMAVYGYWEGERATKEIKKEKK